jgi:DNA (cytosine-5)-methyltransferase 1
MKLKLLDLFSGIGGFSLGLESTGYFETIAFVEKDKFCQQVLKKNFKDIPIESEVRDVKGDRYAADIVCGGFPCQPFSVAGKRKGTDDDRYLWDETIRIVRECKPRWFIGENVEGIINIQEGVVLRQVCDDLEKEGFEVQCVVIPASGIGAWHQRKRVWILAYSKHNGSHRSKRNETIESSNQSKEWLFIRDDQDVSNTIGKLSDGCSSTTRVSTTELKRLDSNEKENRNEVRSKAERCSEQTISNTNTEGLQGHNSKQRLSKQKLGFVANKNDEERKTWWQTQSELCGVPDGVSYELDKDRTNRIKSLGNSIVPLIARELGLAIIKAEEDV